MTLEILTLEVCHSKFGHALQGKTHASAYFHRHNCACNRVFTVQNVGSSWYARVGEPELEYTFDRASLQEALYVGEPTIPFL
jgi:hypothetical protein